MRNKIEFNSRDAQKPTLMEELCKTRETHSITNQGLLTAWDR